MVGGGSIKCFIYYFKSCLKCFRMDNRRTTRRVPHQGADSRTISVANEMNRAPEPEPTIPAEQEGMNTTDGPTTKQFV